jgi:hypothetical protein
MSGPSAAQRKRVLIVRAHRQQVAIDRNNFAANTVFLRKFDKR